MQILAFLTSFTIYGCDISLSISIPVINFVSEMDPPVFPYTLMRSNTTSFLSKSATLKIALTAISPNYSLYLLTTFEPRAVIAASINFLLPFS